MMLKNMKRPPPSTEELREYIEWVYATLEAWHRHAFEEHFKLREAFWEWKDSFDLSLSKLETATRVVKKKRKKRK
jgi:hypothetical protein